MTKSAIADAIESATGVSGVAANRAAGEVMAAVVKELQRTGTFKLPSIGTFHVRRMKARKALNPRTGEPIQIKARKTVRFKASPCLRRAV